MTSSWKLILLFLLNLAVSVSSDSYLRTSCGTSGNYTSNSIYSSNLNTLFSSLRSDDKIDYGFYNVSEGNNTDQVNAIALCRGDVSTADCRSCLNVTSHDLLQTCPNQKKAAIWHDNCMLRYSNETIFRTPQSSVVFHSWNSNKAADITLFNQALQELLPKLNNEASSGNSTKKFSVGQANLMVFEKLYALAQCTPDLSRLECMDCLNNTFGTIDKPEMYGQQGGRAVGYSCNFRYETYLFYSPPPPTPPLSPTTPLPPVTVPLTASTNSSTATTTGANGNETRTIIIAVVSSAIGMTFSICIFIFVLQLRKPKQKDRVDEIMTAESLQIEFDTIRVATNDFSEANKLGEGGFGSVYKGKFSDGQEIAVKRLSRNSGQGDVEFKNEVLLVAKLQHRNLARLLGFSLQNKERLLIYEFVPNASLDHFLFDSIRRVHLDWKRRYKIIGGIARGLLYLHEDSRLRIIHRDLKASNILLDEDMPKISDFGMARLFSLDQTQGNTSRIVGTYGYMAPEYAMHGQFSVKSDVYSFGVLLLEIASGQRNNCYRNGENVEDLVSFAWESWRNETVFDIVDRTVRDGSRTEIMRCIHIGLLCVQENVAARPTMPSVVLMLSSYSLTLPVPSQPAFFMHSAIEPEAPMLNSSVNEASITEPCPR